MYNKVEICGVNTSRLKVLTEAEKRALLQKIRHGTPAEREQAREEMINGNLKLVLSVIQRFTNRGENLDDLFQVGCIGLMKAIDNFNPDLDVKFSTYGVPMIIGEIRRYLRDNNSIRVSRSLRDTAYKAMQVKERLQAENSREPTVEQIAKELNLPREDVVLALESIVDPVSLYEPVFNDGGDTIYVMDQVGDTRGGDSDWIEEIALRQAISELNAVKSESSPCGFFREKRRWKSLPKSISARLRCQGWKRELSKRSNASSEFRPKNKSLHFPPRSDILRMVLLVIFPVFLRFSQDVFLHFGHYHPKKQQIERVITKSLPGCSPAGVRTARSRTEVQEEGLHAAKYAGTGQTGTRHAARSRIRGLSGGRLCARHPVGTFSP